MKKYLFFISQNYSFPVLRPLQEEIKKQGDDVKWFLYGKEIKPSLLKENEERLFSIESIKEYHPHAVFVPGNVVPSFIPGLKVEVFHGLPSKKIKKNGQLYHYIIREMFDLYCTQGPQSTQIFNTLSMKYKNFSVVETGWPKLDPLFVKKDIKKYSQSKTIFFASTFSPRFSKAEILYPFIKKMIHNHDYHWYITLHPKMSHELISLYKSLENKKVTFVDSTQVIENFPKADIMLCDTSSIMYEFLTQLKPVITFQTQSAEEIFINVENIDQLEDVLIDTLERTDEFTVAIKKYIENVHPYFDGKSSQRVLNAVQLMLQGKHLPEKKKPWNIIRNLKLRFALQYWKI